MAKSVIRMTVLLIIAVLSVGCSAGNEYVQKNSQDIRDIKSKLYLLENDVITINSRLDEMEQIQVTTKSSDVDPALISKLRADVSNLSNMVEFHSNRITSLLESSESDANAILDLQEKLDGKQGKNKKTYAKTTETNNTQSPEILYNDSKKYYDANRLDESLEGFKTFLKDFPRHNLAANSQYWMGEIYYDIDNFDKALLEFEKVEDNYPGSLKAPDAKFKVAMCYLKLEKKTDAVKTLNDLKRFYPDYERMYKVDQFLESLQ